MKQKEMKVLNELAEICNQKTRFVDYWKKRCEELIDKYTKMGITSLVNYYEGEKNTTEMIINELKEIGDKIAELIEIEKRAE